MAIRFLTLLTPRNYQAYLATCHLAQVGATPLQQPLERGLRGAVHKALALQMLGGWEKLGKLGASASTLHASFATLNSSSDSGSALHTFNKYSSKAAGPPHFKAEDTSTSN